MQELNKKQVDILMVEDNAADVFLTKEILSGSERYSYNISAVKDGLEAMAFLHKSDGYEHTPRPDLVILDLNLPKMDGFEVLMEMMKDEALATIPVTVLTMRISDDLDQPFRRNATTRFGPSRPLISV